MENIGWWIGIPAMLVAFVAWGVFFGWLLNGGKWHEPVYPDYFIYPHPNCRCGSCRKKKWN